MVLSRCRYILCSVLMIGNPKTQKRTHQDEFGACLVGPEIRPIQLLALYLLSFFLLFFNKNPYLCRFKSLQNKTIKADL